MSLSLCWRSPADKPVGLNGKRTENKLSASMLLSSALQLSKDKGTFDQAYEIVDSQPLARGAFALVWRCNLRKATSGMLYVVKCIDRARLQKVDKQNLFGFDGRDGEIRLHSKLIHPNIVRLISVYEEPEVVSVVLESCNGGDLFEHISAHRRAFGGGCSASGSAACMRQLLGALTFLHTGRIVHRDVKSENVLLCQDGVPLERNTFKLGDFGFAVCLNQVKGGKLCTVMGSPSTVAPEVLLNKAYGTPADLWSGGVVLYNLLSATQPFKAASPKEIMKKVKAAEFSFDGPAWQNVDEEAKELLLGLMCVNTDTRLRAPQALLHNFLVPDFMSADSKSTLRSGVRSLATGKGKKPPCLSRSITADSIAEDDDGTDCQSYGTTSAKEGLREADLQHNFESARSSRLPSIATITTEASVADSEYGLSDWQINSVGARHRTPTGDTPVSPTLGNTTDRDRINTAATRHSRLTSSSGASAGDSPYGLSENQMSQLSLSRPCITEEVLSIDEAVEEDVTDAGQGNLPAKADAPVAADTDAEDPPSLPTESPQPLMEWWAARIQNGRGRDASNGQMKDLRIPKRSNDLSADIKADRKPTVELDPEQQASEHAAFIERALTPPVAPPVFRGGAPTSQAALDVLGSRLQEAHEDRGQPSPRTQDTSFAEEEEEDYYDEDEEEEYEEVEEEEGEELSPFIYRRPVRKIADVYGVRDPSMNHEAHGRRGICCGLQPAATPDEDLPWWQKLWF